MKICLTVNSSPWSRFKGGGQIAVHHLACALHAKGHEVHVLYSRCPGEAVSVSVPYKIHWVRHFNVATVNLNIFSFGWALCRLTRKNRFDVIHGNAEEAFFASRAGRKFGAKFFFTSHAPRIPSTGILRGLLNPLFFLKNVNFYLLRFAAARARRIVTFSQFSKNLVVAGLGQHWEDRVEVIAPGIESSWFEVERNPASEPSLIFWGRMEEEKGIPELLQALKNVAESVPEVRLTLIGEGNRLDEYKALTETLGIAARVTFTGWLEVPQIQDLAARCRLGIFPSRIESFGLSAAEAMAAQLPVIATRAGALPEIVDDGVTGTLVPSRDPQALGRAIEEALADPSRCSGMAEKGREVIRRSFSWDAAADKIIELYLGENGGQSGTQ